MEPHDHNAGACRDSTFQAYRPDGNQSPAFDGQALQDEHEAEMLRDDEERENELKELLTTAFDDEDGDLLEDDCSSVSSRGSNESGAHSTEQQGTTAWHHGPEVRGRVTGALVASTPLAPHPLPPLLTPYYEAPAADKTPVRRGSNGSGASPQHQLPALQLASADSRPRTAASGRSGDTSNKSGDACGRSRDASVKSGGDAGIGSSGSTALPVYRDHGHALQARYHHCLRQNGDMMAQDCLDMSSSSGSSSSSAGSCLQLSTSHYVEQFSDGVGLASGAVVEGGRLLQSLSESDNSKVFPPASPHRALVMAPAGTHQRRRASSPLPLQLSPLPPRDDGDGALQADFFGQGIGMRSDDKQLEILLHAKSRQLHDLTERYELLQLETSKEIRLLKHQLALLEGENRGLDGSLKEARSLLAAAAEERQRLHSDVEHQQAAVRRLIAERDKAVDEQHSAEATAEALSQQLLTIGGSDGLARARHHHDAVITALTERHEAALNDQQRVVADLTAQLRAQKEECELLRSEAAAAKVAMQNKQAEHADIVNKLAKSLEESQRQNNDLLLTGTTQELMKLRVELQQATASRILTEHLCSSLQSEVEQLKEQLGLYEAANSLGVMAPPAGVGASSVLEKSSLLLPKADDDLAQKLDWRTPAISRMQQPPAIPRSPSPILHDGASPTLKSELQRALCSTKAKREQISALQATIRELEKEVHDAACEHSALKQRFADVEACLHDREAELKLYKRAAEQGSSISEVKNRREQEALTEELHTTRAQLEETTKRLHEVAASEECLNDINDELRRQMAQLVKDFDEDKRASLDKCQETLLKHHEDVKNLYVAEQREVMERELAEHEARSRAVLLRLRQELDDKEKELIATKDQYVLVCEEKRQCAELAAQQIAELKGLCEGKEINLRAQLDSHQLTVDSAVLAAKQKWAEQQSELWSSRLQCEVAQARSDVAAEWEKIIAKAEAAHAEREQELAAVWQRRLADVEQEHQQLVSDLQAKAGKEYKEAAAKYEQLQSKLKSLERAAESTGAQQETKNAADSTKAADAESAEMSLKQLVDRMGLASSLPARVLAAECHDDKPSAPKSLAATWGAAPSSPTAERQSPRQQRHITTVASCQANRGTAGTAERRHEADMRELRAVHERRVTEILALHTAEMDKVRAQHEAEKSELVRQHESAALEQTIASEGLVRSAVAEVQQACEAHTRAQLAAQEAVLGADHERRVAELERDLNEMRALAKRLEDMLEASRQRHAESITELTRRHEENLAEIRARHEQGLAEAKRHHEENLKFALSEAQRIRAMEVERAGLECRDLNGELQRACNVLERQQASQEQQQCALVNAAREQRELQAALKGALESQQAKQRALDAAEQCQQQLRTDLNAAQGEQRRLQAALVDAEQTLATADGLLRSTQSALADAIEERRGVEAELRAAKEREHSACQSLSACQEECEQARADEERARKEQHEAEEALRSAQREQQCTRTALLGASEVRLQLQSELHQSRQRQQQLNCALGVAEAEQQRLDREVRSLLEENERLVTELRHCTDERQRLESAARAAADEKVQLEGKLSEAACQRQKLEQTLEEAQKDHRSTYEGVAAQHEQNLNELAAQYAAALSAALKQSREEADRDKKMLTGVVEKLTADMRSVRERLVDQHKQNLEKALEDVRAQSQAEAQTLVRRARSEALSELEEARHRLSITTQERDQALLAAESLWTAAEGNVKAVLKSVGAQCQVLATTHPTGLPGSASNTADVAARCLWLQQSSAQLNAAVESLSEQKAKVSSQLVQHELALQRSDAVLATEQRATSQRILVLETELGALKEAHRELIEQQSRAQVSSKEANGTANSDSRQRQYTDVLMSVQEDVSTYIVETNRKAADMIHTEVSAARSMTERLRKFCLKSLKKIITGQRENQQLVSELSQLRSALSREEWKSRHIGSRPQAGSCCGCVTHAPMKNFPSQCACMPVDGGNHLSGKLPSSCCAAKSMPTAATCIGAIEPLPDTPKVTASGSVHCGVSSAVSHTGLTSTAQALPLVAEGCCSMGTAPASAAIHSLPASVCPPSVAADVWPDGRVREHYADGQTLPTAKLVLCSTNTPAYGSSSFNEHRLGQLDAKLPEPRSKSSETSRSSRLSQSALAPALCHSELLCHPNLACH